jgi:hypothetical protein
MSGILVMSTRGEHQMASPLSSNIMLDRIKTRHPRPRPRFKPTFPRTTVLHLGGVLEAAVLARGIKVYLHIHPGLLAVELTPQVVLMTVTIALSGTLVHPVLALV